jgi:RNA methyltransferase, TrmH family
MLSKQQQKYVHSLHNKKNRLQENVFLVEGYKNLTELLRSDFQIERLFLTEKFSSKELSMLKNIRFEEATTDELQRISTIQTNDAGLAVVVSKPNNPLVANENEWVLVLDNINDPGNLGTIIRIADWYGIKKIICSPQTVECYNPKVIMATMGSFCRVQLYYTELETYLSEQKLPILGAFLEGESIHQFQPKGKGYLVIGSESHGISAAVENFISQKITIPRFGEAESLNAGVATAILLDNLIQKS